MSETLFKLITLLNDGQFHAIANLSHALHLPSSQLLQLLSQLELLELDLEIETDNRCRLINPIELLNKPLIMEQLTEPYQKFIDLVEILPITASTNTYLTQSGATTTLQTQICFAEQQTAGRGRRGKTWQSPFGRNIYLSILWHFNKPASQLGCLSLAIGIAVIKALEQYGIKQELMLKWPNDIYWRQRKLVGILVELPKVTQQSCSTVIGVGVNLSMPATAVSAINQPWIDIATITGETPRRNQLAGLLLEQLLQALNIYQLQGFTPFKSEWQQYDCSLAAEVNIITPTMIIQGIGRGIDENGYFLLEDKTGNLLRFASGEVSLRLNNALK